MDLKKYNKLNIRYNLINYKDIIIIAMSSGPDSLFLFRMLKKIQHKLNLTLYFAHINHKLRGKESDLDEKFVIELGKTNSIITYTKKVDIREYSKLNKLSEEEAGREVRYKFFRELKKKLGVTKVALAHNEDDQVETFLFRLIRGTSFKGLEGIPTKREFFIRPILNYRKKEILEYLDINKIEYRIDQSNFDTVYTRNRIRLDLIKTIENEYNINFKDKIINLISDISEINDTINCDLKYFLKSDILDISKVKKESKFTQRVIISEYLQKFNISINRNKIFEIQHLIYTDGSKEIYGNKDFSITKIYNQLKIVKRKKDQLNLSLNLMIPGSIMWNNYRITTKLINEQKEKKEKKINKNEFFLKLKKDDILTIRPRVNGDIFYPVGIDGKKKISRLFIDLKIPKEKREYIPIITYLDKVVCIGDIRLDKNFEDLKKNSVKLFIEEVNFSAR